MKGGCNCYLFYLTVLQVLLSNIHNLSVFGKLKFMVPCEAKYPVMQFFET